MRRVLAVPMVLAVAVLLLAGTVAGCGSSKSQFPAKDITLIIPWAAGGGSTTESQILADSAKKYLDNKSIILEFKPGGGGSIGHAEGSRAPADGHTMLLAQTGPLLLQPRLHLGAAAYDINSFKFIAQTSVRPFVLLAKGDSKWNSLQDIVEDARQRPGEITVAYTGIGSGSELPVMQLMEAAGIKLKLVPFTGGADVRANIIGGHVDVGVHGLAGLIQYFQSGDLKPIALFNEERVPQIPDVRTAKEQGFDVTMPLMEVLLVPKATPDATVEKLRAKFGEIMKDPDYLAAMKKAGAFPTLLVGDEARKNWEAYDQQVKAMVDKLGVEAFTKPE